MPDAGRVAPISGSVSYQIDRLKSGFEAKERTVVPGHCALMATRLASGLFSAALGRVAPHQWQRLVLAFSDSVWCLRLVVSFSSSVQCLSPFVRLRFTEKQLFIKGARRKSGTQDLYYTTKTLLAKYLTSYTNTLQLIGYQCFIQCKILQIPPTRNLHNLHAATRHKYGRVISQHRGTEKSVAPTDFSTSLCRIIYCIRPNRLRGSWVRCVRCMQGCVRYFEIILHS